VSGENDGVFQAAPNTALVIRITHLFSDRGNVPHQEFDIDLSRDADAAGQVFEIGNRAYGGQI
jgi:hypothetical protein